MQAEEFKEIKLNLFQKVDLKLKDSESAVLVLVCVGVFGISVFVGGQVMSGYDKKVAQIFRSESVLAAEDQKSENIAGSKEDASLEGKKASEAMSDAAGSVKSLAIKTARARRLARQRAANAARIRSGPVLAGPTKGLSDGRRVCALKNDHPQSGGKLHVDEDCCPDPNEYPNPRCAYTPGQMGILKRR